MKEIKRIFIDLEGLCAAPAELKTFKELSANFPHERGCGKSEELTQVIENTQLDMGDPRIGSVTVKSYFLRCDECHVKREHV